MFNYFVAGSSGATGYKVIKELCKQNHPRFTNFYDFAQTSNIEISSILKKMLEELRREESCIH